MNRDAMSLQNEKILYETQRTPMKAKALVVGAAHGSMGLTRSMTDLSVVSIEITRKK